MWINLNALWKIVVVGLLAGAGLPAVFAVGMWALNLGRKPATVSATTGSPDVPREVEDESILGGSSAGLAIGLVCFAIFLAGIGAGIYYIVSGA
jgi:hypothetical protein